MRILKNLIEVQPDDNAKSVYIHRDNIAGLRSYKNHPINDKGEYILIIYLKHPINDREDFVVGCTDVEPYINWLNGDYTPEKSIVRDTCKCCNEQMDSVSQRPAFANELLCNMCNDAKIALKQIDDEKTMEYLISLAKPPTEPEHVTNCHSLEKEVK